MVKVELSELSDEMKEFREQFYMKDEMAEERYISKEQFYTLVQPKEGSDDDRWIDEAWDSLERSDTNTLKIENDVLNYNLDLIAENYDALEEELETLKSSLLEKEEK